MNDFFPEEPKKLKERISRYKRLLKKDYSDGGGKRYLIGPMYQLLGNGEGALEYYSWFNKKYDDDSGDPYMRLCWTLALIQDGQDKAANAMLKYTMLSNIYLVPLMLGTPIDDYQIRFGSNWEDKEYAEEIPQELLRLWGIAEKDWAKKAYFARETTAVRERYILINKKLDNLEVGNERTALVMESSELKYGRKPDWDSPTLRLVKES